MPDPTAPPPDDRDLADGREQLAAAELGDWAFCLRYELSLVRSEPYGWLEGRVAEIARGMEARMGQLNRSTADE